MQQTHSLVAFRHPTTRKMNARSPDFSIGSSNSSTAHPTSSLSTSSVRPFVHPSSTHAFVFGVRVYARYLYTKKIVHSTFAPRKKASSVRIFCAYAAYSQSAKRACSGGYFWTRGVCVVVVAKSRVRPKNSSAATVGDTKPNGCGSE